MNREQNKKHNRTVIDLQKLNVLQTCVLRTSICISLSGLAGDGGVMDGLRTELSAIVERSRIGDRKQQELEQIITRLEDEVSRYSTQTIQLEERLADKMAQIASLESKLGQRNLKVVDLQNELEEKISENSILQREVRNVDGDCH